MEINAILKTARQVISKSDKSGKVIAVMQPHRYSRLESLFDEFCTCFNDADTVIISDVYEAGESPIDGIDKVALVNGIKDCGHKDVNILDSDENLPQFIAQIANEGDYVVCLGAGDITRWANELPDNLKVLFEKRQLKSA